MYTRRYRVRRRRERQKLYRKQVASVLGCSDNEDEIPKISLCVEAAVHGIAGKYTVPRLKELSGEAYQAIVQMDEWSPQTAVQSIRSIKIVYSTTKPSDQLRDFVVWKTQIDYLGKSHSSDFRELFTSNGDFAWDLVTKCRAKTWVWCRTCVAIVCCSRGTACAE